MPLQSETVREAQQFDHAMISRLGRHAIVEGSLLPPCTLALPGHQADPPPPSGKCQQRRTVSGLSRQCEVIAAGNASHQSQRLAGRRPRLRGHDRVDIGIALEDAFGAGIDQHLDPGLRKAMAQRAHQRRREQHIAQPPQRDDENSWAFGQQLGLRAFGAGSAQHHAASHADADDIGPAMGEIE